MLNLLFISNSPKMDFIKKNLQPMLKVKIDVVTDFDHGLKDVFEKRPATIIIQDQISGVTGESVARHIQMLLGSGAPVFVMMHEGNTRIKPIKGLFEHIIDLTQADTKLVEDVQTILKSILGPEWEKIFIAPKQNAAALAASFAMPEDSRVDADRLVDDFLSDLGNTDQSGQVEAAQLSSGQIDQPEEEPLKVESTSDEMVRLLVESAKQSSVQDTTSAAAQSIQQIESEVPAVALQTKQKDKISKTAKPSTRKAPPRAILPETPPLPEVSDTAVEAVSAPEPKLEPQQAESPVSVEAKPAIFATPTPDTAHVAPQANGGELSPVPPSPADFRIIPASEDVQEQIPEDLLQAFEENYRSQASNWKRLTIVVVAVIGLGAGGWLLIKQKPGLLSLMTNTTTSPPISVSQKDKPTAVPVAKPQVVLQKPISTARKPVAAIASPLPSFMSTARRDDLFSAQKPGWERYVGKVYEYRIFRSGDNIKVVQVLAGIGTQTVNDSFLATVLKEFVGNIDYSVNSREQKQGYLVQRGSVGQKADLLIYRSKKTGGIRAFVVSLN